MKLFVFLHYVQFFVILVLLFSSSRIWVASGYNSVQSTEFDYCQVRYEILVVLVALGTESDQYCFNPTIALWSKNIPQLGFVLFKKN